MFGYNFQNLAYQAFIIRLMVDERFQSKGFGRFGLEKMLEIFRAEDASKWWGSVMNLRIRWQESCMPVVDL